MRAGLLAMIFVAALGAMPAQAMSVTDFLVKADALKAKGMMAVFSSDLGLLKTEAIEGSKAWRAQAHAPNACPPPGPQKMTSDEILAMMQAVPPAQRGATSASQAITAGLNRRYPCRG